MLRRLPDEHGLPQAPERDAHLADEVPGDTARAWFEARALVERVRLHLGMGHSAAAWHLHNLGYFDRDLSEMLILGEPDADQPAGFEEDTRFDGLERRVMLLLAGEKISRGRARELLGGREPEAVATAP